MELKETNHLLSSVDINGVKPSERNNSDKPSVYDITSSAEEEKDGDLAMFPLWIGFRPGDQQK